MLGFYNANTDQEYPDEQPHDSEVMEPTVLGLLQNWRFHWAVCGLHQAKLVGVIALDGGSEMKAICFVHGLDNQNKDRFSIDVMSLSLGGPVVIPGATNTGSSSISQALDVAVEAGIVTVVAIGNGNLGLVHIQPQFLIPVIVSKQLR